MITSPPLVERTAIYAVPVRTGREIGLSELEEHWANALAEAERRARTLGRKDLADYVALRSANDLVRRTAVEWLMSTFTTLATEVNGGTANLVIEHQDHHRFRIGQATMVGQLLT